MQLYIIAILSNPQVHLKASIKQFLLLPAYFFGKAFLSVYPLNITAHSNTTLPLPNPTMAPIFKIATLLSCKYSRAMRPPLKLTITVSLYAAAQGTQFITGVCASDAECASACCGFTSGKCAAPFVANERGEGCGFGDAQPNNNALAASKGAQGQANASAPAAPATPPPAAAAAAPAAKAGTQFITGACTSDTDCASACCGFKSGKVLPGIL
jgi:hypothetical protein